MHPNVRQSAPDTTPDTLLYEVGFKPHSPSGISVMAASLLLTALSTADWHNPSWEAAADGDRDAGCGTSRQQKQANKPHVCAQARAGADSTSNNNGCHACFTMVEKNNRTGLVASRDAASMRAEAVPGGT